MKSDINILRRVWQRGRSAVPLQGFVFGRPLVVLQSDDWGRVGVRDRETWDELRNAGINLGERNYDFYSLETAQDIEALVSLLSRHRDSAGGAVCLGMNFILANADFAKITADNFRQIHLRPLTEGLPDGWVRPGLFEAYRQGISAGVLSPALHGTTHFCLPAAERYLNDPGERGNLLRTLWKSGVPYIYWRMPWIGFEYSDPGKNRRESFLRSETQEPMIADAVKTFRQFFSQSPRSACAPGYRANKDTHQAWAKSGVQVAQNGPGGAMPPHFEGNHSSESNPILHLYRTLDFEPSTAEEFSVVDCLRKVEAGFALGIPAVVSVHSINFHSALKDFRTRTLRLLDDFLSALESKYPDLVYVRDEDLYDLVTTGRFESPHGAVSVQVTKRMFNPAPMEKG